MTSERGNPAWASLPRKGQLLVLCLIRVTEPITRFCVNSYIFYQLQYLGPSLREDEIIQQASYLRSAYTLAQCVSSLLWVRIADSPRGGRKLVMLLALSFSFFSVLGLGFTSSFKQALIIHVAQGFSNGNTAIVRTIISEVVPQERFQPRAFVLLPICTSVATILGPLIASLTIEAKPQAQGEDQSLLKRYPYALPALMNSTLLLVSLVATFLFLEETLEPLRGRHNAGVAFFRRVASWVTGSSTHQLVQYEAIPLDAGRSKEMAFVIGDEDEDEASSSSPSSSVSDSNQDDDKRAPFLLTRRIFTRTMLSVLFAQILLDIQIGVTGDAMFNLFSFPVASEEQQRRMELPFRFTGGAGFRPSSLAWTTCIFGLMKLLFQLLVYPRVAQRLGVLKTWRYFMFAFPLIWLLYPYFAVMPSSAPPPSEKTGIFIWGFVVFLAVASGLFVGCSSPCQLILTAQSSPHPSALGRTQSITFLVSTAVSASSAALSGSLLAYGLNRNLAGLPFWFSSVIGVVAVSTSPFVKEGNGHEIRLLGDD